MSTTKHDIQIMCTCNAFGCAMHPARKATYERMAALLGDVLGDLAILAGERVGPSKASWQDVAGTCAVNLRLLASQLEQARKGNAEAFITFPSPAEALDTEDRS